jgi:hypothetical protein
MRDDVDLLLAPSDLWRRHGPLNVIVTLACPLLALAGAVALVVKGTYSVTQLLVVAMMMAAPLTNRQALRSALAIVSRRPYLTISDSGLHVDGCIFDSLYFAWSDIEAMSPEPASIQAALKTGQFVVITFRVRIGSKRRWTFSSMQHTVHQDYFEISGYFRPPPAHVLDVIGTYFASHVKRHEPFLLSDMPD